MKKQYKYVTKIPHGDNCFSVPISGLFVELLDRKKLLSMPEFNPEIELSIEKKHKNASERIATCVFYLATISHRLLDIPGNSSFANKRLDWECLQIYPQIMLDSFAVLVPMFYGIQEEYQGKCPICNNACENKVSSFNNLNDWFAHHKLNDKLTQRYKLIRKNNSWYKLLNTDRKDFIHHSIVPNILSKNLSQELGWANKMKKDKLIKPYNSKNIKPMKISTLEKELKIILRNLFELLAFSSYFFVVKLKERKIVVSEKDQFKYILDSDFRSFNKLVF